MLPILGLEMWHLRDVVLAWSPRAAIVPYRVQAIELSAFDFPRNVGFACQEIRLTGTRAVRKRSVRSERQPRGLALFEEGIRTTGRLSSGREEYNGVLLGKLRTVRACSVSVARGRSHVWMWPQATRRTKTSHIRCRSPTIAQRDIA